MEPADRQGRREDRASDLEADRGVRYPDASAHQARRGLLRALLGWGSQIIAGEATGRRVYAIEISPQYVDVALKRWQTATGKHAELDADGRSFDEIAGERLPRAA